MSIYSFPGGTIVITKTVEADGSSFIFINTLGRGPLVSQKGTLYRTGSSTLAMIFLFLLHNSKVNIRFCYWLITFQIMHRSFSLMKKRKEKKRVATSQLLALAEHEETNPGESFS